MGFLAAVALVVLLAGGRAILQGDSDPEVATPAEESDDPESAVSDAANPDATTEPEPTIPPVESTEDGDADLSEPSTLSGGTNDGDLPGTGDGQFRLGVHYPPFGPFLVDEEEGRLANAIARQTLGATELSIAAIEGDDGRQRDRFTWVGAEDTVEQFVDDSVDAMVTVSTSEDVLRDGDQQGMVLISAADFTSTFAEYSESDLFFSTTVSDELMIRFLAAQFTPEEGPLIAPIYEAGDDRAARNAAALVRALNGASPNITFPYSPGEISSPSGVIPAPRESVPHLVYFGEDHTVDFVEELASLGVGPGPDSTIWIPDLRGFDSAVETLADEPEARSALRTLGRAATFDDEWRNRLLEKEPIDNFELSAEVYDAITILALAGEAAETDSPADVAAEIADITRSGAKCDTYQTCVDLIRDGQDIDYDGVGGAYELSDAGEVTVADLAVVSVAPDGTEEAVVTNNFG